MSQAPPSYVTEVVFNARVHALEVRLAVLEGRSVCSSYHCTPPLSPGYGSFLFL